MTKIFTRRLDDGTIVMGTVSGGAAPVQLDMTTYVSGWLPPDWNTWPPQTLDVIKRALDRAEREHKMGFMIQEARCEPDWDAPGAVEGFPSRYTLHVVALSHLPVQH